MDLGAYQRKMGVIVSMESLYKRVTQILNKRKEQEYVFITRGFWLEMKAPMHLVRHKYKYYFGEEDLLISERTEAICVSSADTN